MIRLDALRIQNFRCVSEGTVTFNKDVTVLVADNGIGKTTLLDAVSLVLARFVDELTKTRQSSGILQSDVRLTKADGGHQTPRTPTILQVIAEFDGRQVEWTCRRKRHDQTPRVSPKDVAEINSVVAALRATKPSEDAPDVEVILPGVILPIVAYYRSNRFALNSFFGEAERRKVRELDGRLSGYRIYLEPLSDSLHFNKWYRRMFLAVKTHPVTGARREDSALQQLAAVNDAVGHVLKPTGWQSLNWSEVYQSVTAQHADHGELPIGLLSSGIRTTIAVVADIAHRCASLNPHLGQDITRLTPGVVLVDEVDLHLHPAWQQLILELLRAAFPSVQFILSTHSPQVLSTVDSSAIRVIQLRNGKAQIKPPVLQTRGVESADVLARVMEVDPIPKVEQAGWLSSYKALVQYGDHESEVGKSLWERLVNHFGSEHPVLSEIETIRRLQEFKRANGIPLTVPRGFHAQD
jgi:predicted ATP-binding protein involved in virulence